MSKRKIGLIVNPIAGLVSSDQPKSGYAVELGSKALTVGTSAKKR